MNKTGMSYRCRPFCSDMILMRFVSSSFQLWSRAFLGINNTSVFCLVFFNIAVGFSTALYRYFARHCCWHRNFQLSPSGFHCELEFFIVWFNKEQSSQLSGIVELRFFDGPSLFCFFLLHQTYASTYLATHCLDERLFVSSKVSHQTMKIHSVVCLSFNVMAPQTNEKEIGQWVANRCSLSCRCRKQASVFRCCAVHTSCESLINE